MPEPLLIWEFDDGRWRARSSVPHAGRVDRRLSWIICVTEDSSFAVNRSDAELTTYTGTFTLLRYAKAFCEAGEQKLLTRDGK